MNSPATSGHIGQGEANRAIIGVAVTAPRTYSLNPVTECRQSRLTNT
jgi:hypothetical protein